MRKSLIAVLFLALLAASFAPRGGYAAPAYDYVITEPDYFYEILPYAYVLGVSDKWLKAYETIAEHSPPRWRRTNRPYSKPELFSVMDAVLKPGESPLSSRPSSSRSGGGPPGGGSGGGRGGSW